MVVENDNLESADTAILTVEAAGQSIIHCSAALAELLDREVCDVVGEQWPVALGVASKPEQALTSLIASGVRSVIPPTLLSPTTSSEMVVGGYLYPEQRAEGRVLVLLLFRLGVDQDFLFSEPVGHSDVLAVLGMESFGDGLAAVGNTARKMMDIRFGLQQIVPVREDVGMPRGSTIPIALRRVTLQQAEDIGKALLSHLTPLLQGGARIRIGLAQCSEHPSPMFALIAANNALLKMQRTSAAGLVAAASAEDVLFLGTSASSTDGIFSDDKSPDSQAYLNQLAALETNPQHIRRYLEEVFSLTLQQKGVFGLGVYRRSFDDSYEFIAGALQGNKGAIEHEKQMPRTIRQCAQKVNGKQLQSSDRVDLPKTNCAVFALRLYERVLGFIAVQYQDDIASQREVFEFDVSALHYLAMELSTTIEWRQGGEQGSQGRAVAVRPIEERIDGYVGDNMEGAIDQAVFLAKLDVPVAVIGPRGTGKLYVAKVIHQESGAVAENLVSIDCREFRGRKDALTRIARELERSEGKTLVFKSPHLMNSEAQIKLARQVSSRVLADSNPPRYLAAGRIIGLFPDSLEKLVQRGELHEKLASVFAAYPIRVPPIKDRKRAVLRWAYKILTQEGERRDRKLIGFTPDAEQAMLQHDWPGNISEMRQCIVTALDRSEKEWLTPVDLGLFKGLSPAGSGEPKERAYLQLSVEPDPEDTEYAPTTLEELSVALGEALHRLMETDTVLPLGAWLDDEVVLAVYERYRENMRAAADFLQTKPRNLGRWMPKIQSREAQRSASSLWQTPQKLIRRWLKESAPLSEPPQQLVQGILLSHVVSQCDDIGIADRARIMGVSTPTYQKRLQELTEH